MRKRAKSSLADVVVEVPGRKVRGRFRYTSQLGFNGCQGFVQPGVLIIDGQKHFVQTKSFYKETYDDRGEQFFQNPTEEVNNSYRAFCELQERGFRVLPFFGKMKLGRTPLLVLYDLREGETREIYDEKHLHRGREVSQLIKGKEYRIDARKTVQGLENYRDIQLGFMQSGLLACAHGIYFGLAGGTEHTITRDPSTNRGDIFLCDIGQYDTVKSKYRDQLPLEQLLNICDDEVLPIFARMLALHHPQEKAEKLYEEYLAQEPEKKRFLDYIFQAIVGASLLEHIGGWYRDDEFAREIFPRNTYGSHFMKVKFHFVKNCLRFKEITGKEIYAYTPKEVEEFKTGISPQSLWKGIEWAQLAVLDRRMHYLRKARHAIDQQQTLPTPSQKTRFNSEGLPRLFFFENPDEPLVEKMIVPLSPQSRSAHKHYELSVEFDWEDAYDLKKSACTGEIPSFDASQIRGLSLEGKTIEGFDPKKIRVQSGPPDIHGTWYFYGRELIYVNYRESS